MRSAVQARDESVASFRSRLFTAIMIIVVTLTALGFYLAQRKVTADAERNLQENFQAEFSWLKKLKKWRPEPWASRSTSQGPSRRSKGPWKIMRSTCCI